MKAIRIRQFGEPDVCRLEEAPDPQPGPGQVLVRVQAAGVNPVETYIRSGIYGPREFPFTPGTDAGGTVQAIGAGVSRVTVGQRVYTAGSISGTYAELALCREDQVHPLPAKTSFAQGAAIGVPYATAHRALFGRGQARAGEVVLVHGASGGVGIAAVQLARSKGLTVIGTAGSDRGRALVAEHGANHVLDHGDSGYLGRVMELTQGRGVDVVLEMLANVNLGNDLTVLAPRGRVVVIGSRGPTEINPRETMRRDADIRGMLLANTPADELATIHRDLAAGLERGDLRPVIGQEIPLAQAARAHVAVMQSGAHGKIVLVP